jgi:hypothetical protein
MSTNIPAGCSCPLAWSDFIISQSLFLPLLSGLYPVASFTRFKLLDWLHAGQPVLVGRDFRHGLIIRPLGKAFVCLFQLTLSALPDFRELAVHEGHWRRGVY